MNSAHSYEISLNGVDVVDQVEGEEWNINIFPADGFDQIEDGLAKLYEKQVVHAENLHVALSTKICRYNMTHFHSLNKLSTPILFITPITFRFGL